MRRITQCATALTLLLHGGSAQAVQVTLTTSDAPGQSSFNSGLHWSNGQAPSAANTYVVPPGFTLRTPAGGGSGTFAGSSLTISGLSGPGGGSLEFAGTAGSVITVNNLILDYGYVTGDSGFTLAGNITLASGGGFFDSDGSNSTLVTAPISGSSDAYIVNPGTVVRFSAANSYLGKTFILDTSTLQLENANAVQNSTVVVDANNKLAFGSGIGTFNIGGLSGNAAIKLTDTASNSVQVNVGGNGQATTYSGVLTGGGSLKKVGSGTLNVSGSNTYGIAGQTSTTVSDGTLLINNTSGSGTGIGNVLVTGGTLGGTGTVGGSVTVNGGTLSPGNSPGVLTLGGDLLLLTGKYKYEVDSAPSTTADLVNVTGDLIIGPGSVTLAASDLGSSLLAMGTKFSLINYGGDWNGGIFDGLPNYSTSLVIGSNRFAIRYDDTSGGSNFGGGSLGLGSHYVTITAVPEGSSFLIFGLGGIFAVAIRRLANKASKC